MNLALFWTLMSLVEILDSSHLEYSVPVGAKKTGPGGGLFGDGDVFRYFYPGDNLSEETLVAMDTVIDGKLRERSLFKNGKKHGVQTTWHANGRIESSSPYKGGIRSGAFERWDDEGRLIARYRMLMGFGTQRTYDSTGLLMEEAQYLDNDRNGQLISRTSSQWTISQYRNGNQVSVTYAFYFSGGIAGLTHFSDDGLLNGPYLEVNPEGMVTRFSLYIERQKVDAKAYLAAIKNGLELPPYFEDPQEYVRRIPKDIRETVDRLMNERPVRVPLVLGEDGVPIEAH